MSRTAVAFGTPVASLGPDDDRREKFADWLTDPKNKFFARSVANRVWFHLMGRGVVDPSSTRSHLVELE